MTTQREFEQQQEWAAERESREFAIERFQPPMDEIERLELEVDALRRRLECEEAIAVEAVRQRALVRGALFGAIEQVRQAAAAAARAAADAGLYAGDRGPDSPLRLIETPGGPELTKAIGALHAALDQIDEECGRVFR